MSEDLINKDELKAAMEETAPETSGGEDYSDVELEAIEHGWNPDGVEGKKNLSAEEFMDRKPLYDKIHATEKKLRRLEEGMDAMKAYNKTIEERTRERVINELKAQKRAALEDENYDAVIEIDERIAETKAAPAEPQVNEAFQNWIDENDWYQEDQDMKRYADMIGTGYHNQNPDMPLTEIYKYVTGEVKARFPDKFQNTRRNQPAPVEGAQRGRSSRNKYSTRDLPEQDLQIMRTLVRSGAISEEEYLKQYFG